MSEDSNTKLQKTEVDKIKEIQTKYLQIQHGIGQIRVSLIKLNQQKEILLKAEDEMSSQFIETQNQEKEFVQTLQEKYGEGTLDIEKGLFIPNS